MRALKACHCLQIFLNLGGDCIEDLQTRFLKFVILFIEK